jgi:hypothetical protein
MTPFGASIQPGDFITARNRTRTTLVYVVRTEWEDDLIVLRISARGTTDARWIWGRMKRNDPRILGPGKMVEGDPRLPAGV